MLPSLTVCPRICEGNDPNCLYPYPVDRFPFCTAFTEHGSTTFTRADGKPYEKLDIPLASIAVLAKAAQSFSQIISHGGDVSVRIPQTGQTPLHVLGLCFGEEAGFDEEVWHPVTWGHEYMTALLTAKLAEAYPVAS